MCVCVCVCVCIYTVYIESIYNHLHRESELKERVITYKKVFLIISFLHYTYAFFKSRKILKERTGESKMICNKQRSLCIFTLRKKYRDFLANLEKNAAKNNREIWKALSPSLSQK